MPRKKFDPTKPNTERQKAFLRELPKNGYNVTATAKKVGYTVQSSESGSLYNTLRPKIQRYFEPDYVRCEIQALLDKVIAQDDNSNSARLVELKSKITGLLKETSQVNVALFNIVDDTKPIDAVKVDSDTVTSNDTVVDKSVDNDITP